ncbi:Frizzled-5 [Strongyloides ratti]|uniref:Frizzled-5 n=1 Tax=Strongyloides ratti TaxID=34506 RepID=A0A090MVS3_STRRB|nr:Frizzled-5 [Strongyloides ratti]CEF63083.1 Frizzled-5 [Strongyloides ratti]
MRYGFINWISYLKLLFISNFFIFIFGKRCEQITIPLCRGIGYNFTSYPNSYKHETQLEAALELNQFYPLVEVNCYKHLKFFLCSMYTPICQENYEKSIMPCREVCLEAKKNCAPLMRQYGFNWPASLSCSVLPKMSDQGRTGEICAAPPDTPDVVEKDTKIDKYDKNSSKKNQPTLVYPVIGIDIIENSNQKKCECSCQSPFVFTESSEQRIQNVSNCAYSCFGQLPTQKSKDFINTWMMLWSGICFSLSLFTILTFLIETNRFQYPERPIFFFAFCQFMLSLGFLIRIYIGHQDVACSGDLIKIGNHTLSPCLLVFILTYYFSMAVFTWWIILSLTWVLASGSKWSNEAIAAYAPFYHLFAWFLPGVQTFLVIMLNGIEGDPISGLCFVSNTSHFQRSFVLGPLIVYFSVGVFFLCIGFLNLWHIRSVVKKRQIGNQNANKITQLMSKIGIFSVLYTVPALFYILVLFYEQYYRPLWEQSKLCNCANQVNENENAMYAFSLIKIAAMLFIGWTSGVWVINCKTFNSWKYVICCVTSKHLRDVPYLNHNNFGYNTVPCQRTRFCNPPSPQYHQTEIRYAKTNEAMSPQTYGTLRSYNHMNIPIVPDKV